MLRSLLFVIVLSAGSSAFAIVVRHDRDDARYRELAVRYRGPVGQTGSGGHGTLIAKEWVLTAAHVVDDVSPFQRFVTFGDKAYPVKAVYLHPSWTAGRRGARNDIALIRLETPVKGVRPARLYEKGDEAGKTIAFVGSGMTGDGNTGPVRGDGVWRAAENMIERTEAHAIVFRFDKPPAGSDLEGISGPGDSGSPALLEEKGQLYVVGTSSSNSSPRGGGHCTYGTIETYGRVSTALGWIRTTMRAPGKAADPWSAVERGIPKGALGTVAMAYVKAMNSTDGNAFVAFSDRYWRADALAKAPADERRARAERSQADFGTYTVLAYAERPRGIALLARSSKVGLVTLLFMFSGTEPVKLEGLGRSRVPFEPRP